MAKRRLTRSIKPLPDPEARAAPPRRAPRASGEQTAAWDDIPIPEPRTANEWYCDNCGEKGGTPDPGMMQIDPRYAVGMHDCVRVVKGVRPKVKLVADFHFDRAEWNQHKERADEKRAFMKGMGGSALTPAELVLVRRFKIRHGLPTDEVS